VTLELTGWNSRSSAQPLGAFGSIVFPVLVFVVLARFRRRPDHAKLSLSRGFARVGLPVFVAADIAQRCVVRLVTIISIYRRAAFSKWLPGTPLRRRRFSAPTC